MDQKKDPRPLFVTAWIELFLQTSMAPRAGPRETLIRWSQHVDFSVSYRGWRFYGGSFVVVILRLVFLVLTLPPLVLPVMLLPW